MNVNKMLTGLSACLVIILFLFFMFNNFVFSFITDEETLNLSRKIFDGFNIYFLVISPFIVSLYFFIKMKNNEAKKVFVISSLNVVFLFITLFLILYWFNHTNF